ncbi:hypothetical protein [Thermoactinomyces sp. CICC 10521]|uniref:hypothetical protein n=1 Tax=Thermoactinomyces sp. CICC 10521 TaxID=2767426 RepID=UPI0018DCA619|nr:hypothetical protein [Thermoactinomyces sp. CICC 10521]MBH8608736.1 hypothetical protein [Thermoactinomyces sp. CICC 10521]
MKAILVKKRALVVIILALFFLSGSAIWIWSDSGTATADLTPSEQAALDFWKAIHVDGDAKKAKEIDLNKADWTYAVSKKTVSKVLIMLSPEKPATDTTAQVYIYNPQNDKGYMIDMVKRDGTWKMDHYKSAPGLYAYVVRYYPDHQREWKEVKLR